MTGSSSAVRESNTKLKSSLFIINEQSDTRVFASASSTQPLQEKPSAERPLSLERMLRMTQEQQRDLNMSKQAKPIELDGSNEVSKPGLSSNRVLRESNPQRMDNYASQPIYQSQPDPRAWASQSNQNSVPMAPKVQVESETTYPKPNRDHNLLKAMFNNPESFEGICGLKSEAIQNRIESVVASKLNEKLIPFKLQLADLIQQFAGSNHEEISLMFQSLQRIEKDVKSNENQLVSVGDRYEVLSSKLKLIESSGIKNDNQEDQMVVS